VPHHEHYNIKTYENSISFLMLFPPEDDFFLSVTQDAPTSYFYPARGIDHEGPQTWMQMDLRLNDSIEIRFHNGTTWMKEASPLKGLLLKSFSMSFGLWAPNCPQSEFKANDM
ncbi:uncharacterized protein LOC119569496, partial [Penaeus monodon]|uniref:uncharacterized protein LOC119569496 n=1 Tax=Penaeus monodon TaxID=6687 RepID=UPI0018A7015B